MDININIVDLQQASSNPILFAWVVLRSGGWIPLCILLFFGLCRLLFEAWLTTRQRKFLSKIKYVMLALDIPRGNEQTPKAVEAVFAHLHGIQRSGNLVDRYWRGYVQAQLSFELIGIEGQTQFIVRTPSDLRDLVEAAVYAQYPDAEITEVVDYTEFIPKDFAAAGYDLWGAEMAFTKSGVYPIKTYPFFEHSMTQQFLDPLASLLELMGRLGPTEQIWLQLVITPGGSELAEEAAKEVKKKLGIKIEEAKGLLADPMGSLSSLAYGVGHGVVSTTLASLVKIDALGGEKEEKKEAPPKKFSDLTTGEKSVIEGIQIKLSKLIWETKFRFVYLGQPPYFSKSRGVSGVMGALKQFSTQDMNGFAPEKYSKTGVDYWFVNRRVRNRQRRVLHNYRERELHKKFQAKNSFTRRGAKPIPLNIEELATLYHFPVMTVKAPQVQKTEAKYGEPPMALPFANEQSGGTTPSSAPGGAPPRNLPGA